MDDYGMTCWYVDHTCPTCWKKNMMTNGSLLWCLCGHEMQAKDYRNEDVHIVLDVQNISSSTKGVING